MKQNSLSHARAYLHRGRQPIPVPQGSKGPITPGWQKLLLTEDDLPKHFSNGNNIGLLLGQPSGWLIDVDLDTPESRVLAPKFLPETGLISGRKSSPQSHFWYIAPNVVTEKFKDPICGDGKNATIVELRSTGGQTLVPPSVHPSGEAYEWYSKSGPAKVDAAVLQTAVRRLATCALLARYWADGKRHDLTLALAGALLRASWSSNEVEHFVCCIANVGDDPEIADRRQAVLTTAKKLAKDQRCSGIPTLRNLLPNAVVDRITEWLQLQLSNTEVSVTPSHSEQKQAAPTLRLVRMSDVAARSVSWLWQLYIAIGALTFIEGPPGVGKSTLLCALMAAITRGHGLPGMGSFDPQNVLICSVEDSKACTIRPRLDASDADVNRVFALDEPLTLDALGIMRLKDAVLDIRPSAIFLDPIFAFTGAGTDIHRANETRDFTTRLTAMAEQCTTAVVGVRHLAKGRGGGHALNAGIGSIDLVAHARSVLLVGQDPDDGRKRALVQIKNNLGPIGPSFGFTIEDGKFFWTGETDITADRILSLPSNREERSAIDEAIEFLRNSLSAGDRETHEVIGEAKRVGITDKTLRNARERLGIRARREGLLGTKQRFYWSLPESSIDHEVAFAPVENREVYFSAGASDDEIERISREALIS